MTMNFADALNKVAHEIERPPLLPIGTYSWQITKQPEIDEIANGAYQVVDFHLRCLGAMDDVDPDAIADYGKVQGTYSRLRFMFEKEDKARFDQSMFKLRRFLIDHVKCWKDDDKVSLKEGLANSVNQQFLGSIRWRADKNDTEVQYAEISKTAPLA